jgi:hypothetical protein
MTNPINKCQIRAYNRGSLSPVPGADETLFKAQGLRFSSLFPGGLYGTCSFTVPVNSITDWTPLQGGQRIVVYNSTAVVWEGYITGIVRAATATQALRISCLGAWGDILMRQGIDKPWLDDRIDGDTWPEATAAFGAGDNTLLENMSVDRNSRIRFTPKAVAFADNAYHRVTYSAPTGQTIKRITCAYDMAEAGQAWELLCFDSAGAALFSVTGTGTGTQDVTLGTPRQVISLAFKSRAAAQTPASDGTIYGQVSALKVYTETGNIDALEVCKDVIGYCGDLNTTTAGVGSITRAISPFVTDGWKSFADIVTDAVGFGDTSNNRWYAQLQDSDTAATPNGEPRLVVAQYPSLTTGAYEYAISAADVFAQGIEIEQDFTRLVNDVVLTYTDLNGKKVTYTSADNAALKSTTSITKYGTHQKVVDIGSSDATGAVNFGTRYIAAWSLPPWRASSPIKVAGYIAGAGGQIVPASEIKAGMRVLIRDFVVEPSGDLASGTPLVMIISQAEYTDAGGGSCAITLGPLDVVLTV